MSDLLVTGYYGFNNAGDEAMLAGMVQTFERLRPGLKLAVITGAPAKTARRYGVAGIPRWNPVAIAAAIRRSRLLIIGGGSLLQDVTSLRSIFYYLGLVQLAKLLGRPVMLYGNGIGPVTTLPGRLLMRAVANQLDLITVRDPLSLQALRDLGVTRPRALLTADPALSLSPPPPAEGRRLMQAEGLKKGDGPLVGVSVRPYPGGRRLQAALAEALDRYAARYGAKTVFIPMQLPADVQAADQVRSLMRTPSRVIASHYEVQQLMGIVGQLDLLVGIRFHALVFASLTGVPMVGLSYDPKVDGFLSALGRQSAGSIEDADGERVLAAMVQAWESREHFYAGLADKLRELRDLSVHSARLALELTEGGRGSGGQA